MDATSVLNVLTIGSLTPGPHAVAKLPTIAKNIRKYRIEKGYTQEQLAVYTDRSFEFLRRIESEHGARGFSIETLYRISVVLEKDVGEFFKEEV